MANWAFARAVPPYLADARSVEGGREAGYHGEMDSGQAGLGSAGGYIVADQDEYFVPPTLMGTIYWKDHVVAVIDDHAEAERAVEALVDAGFPRDGTRAWRSEFVMKNHEYYLQQQSLLQRIGSAISAQESAIGQRFGDAASKGHSIVTIEAREQEEAHRARDVLREHGAHEIVYYRPGTIVDL